MNDRLDVALAAGAAGVHLRADSMPVARVRALAPPGFLVGRSVHGEAEGLAVAQAGGVDYLIAGTLFETGRSRRVTRGWASRRSAVWRRGRACPCWASAA